MKNKLFCEISPFTYKISVHINVLKRYLKDMFSKTRFCAKKSSRNLPIVIYKHSSLIRRKLGNVDMKLQNNKAVNLSIACPKINGVIINPGETFSFWKLVGKTTSSKGYKEGLTIQNGKTAKGIGGGLCQFTNLIHWMVLHSPLSITEHHHHDGVDLFPDYNRQIPFGTGTSVSYNYLDYRITNNTDVPYQIIAYVTDTHLCGELRSVKPLDLSWHIHTENEHFVKQGDDTYRKGKVIRNTVDKISGNTIKSECIRENNAKVMYDTKFIKTE